MERETMLIYKSFVDVSNNMNDKDYRKFWDAIHNYGIYGQEIPSFDNPTLNALMTLITPLIRANIKNYENGSKGGAPKGNNNARKTTQKQPVVNSGLNSKTTQKQGNVTVTDTVTNTYTNTLTNNDTDTENVTVTDTDTVTVTKKKKEINPYVSADGIITDWDKYQEWREERGLGEEDDW